MLSCVLCLNYATPRPPRPRSTVFSVLGKPGSKRRRQPTPACVYTQAESRSRNMTRNKLHTLAPRHTPQLATASANACLTSRRHRIPVRARWQRPHRFGLYQALAISNSPLRMLRVVFRRGGNIAIVRGAAKKCVTSGAVPSTLAPGVSPHSCSGVKSMCADGLRTLGTSGGLLCSGDKSGVH